MLSGVEKTMEDIELKLESTADDDLCLSSKGPSLKEKSWHYAERSNVDGTVMSAKEMTKVYQMLGDKLSSSTVSYDNYFYFLLTLTNQKDTCALEIFNKKYRFLI